MPHFYIKSSSISENIIKIEDKENYNHIVKSLRSKVGDEILLIDENETEYKTQISNINNKVITAAIKSYQKSNRDLPYNLYLAQSPLKSGSQLTIMEKATELGVRGVYPIYTDNCALKKSVAESKIEKWNKVMYEASKQCERANIPVCYPLTDLRAVIEDEKFDKIIALCEKNTNGTLKDYLKSHSPKNKENILLVIGPEGGFSTNEFDYMKSKKLPMLSLGELILKAETAVIVTIGNVVYEFGESFKK